MRMLPCAVVALVSSGCTVFGNPTSAADQWSAIHDDADFLGHLDGKLHPVGPKGKRAISPSEPHEFVLFGGSDGNQMCLRFTRYQEVGAAESPKARLAQAKKGGALVEVVFEAYDSLDTAPKAFPAKPSHTKMRILKSNTEYEEYRNAMLELRDRKGYEITYEWCGPAPALTPTTRYITATLFGAETRLYAWQLSEPYSGAAEAPDSAEPADE